MSGLVLRLRDAAPLPDDLRRLQPLELAGLDAVQAAREPMSDLPGSPAIGELFDVTEDSRGQGDHLTLDTGTRRLDFLGRGMTGGTLRIAGNAGAGLGQGLLGGTIIVEGDCGHYAASDMRSGRIEVMGDAGHFLGGALHGDRHGMAGGVVVVHGHAGDRAGHRMRRGLVLVGRGCADACGAGMLAGTIVTPRCGATPGLGLRRGSLIVHCPPADLPVTFNDSGPVDLTWLRLLSRAAADWLPGLLPAAGSARRYCGDLACGGKGEILVLAS